ncbi:MAG: acylphosphatase [bacterium]|nr:acylphosphatase [bacterium]
MEIAYLIKITGRVTGVGFRYSTKHFVNQFADIRGYVRNASEGRVDVEIQGNSNHIEVILEWLKHGPTYARVDSVKIIEIPIDPRKPYFRIT